MTREQKIARIIEALAGNQEALLALSEILQDAGPQVVTKQEIKPNVVYLECISKKGKNYVVAAGGKINYNSDLLKLQQESKGAKKKIFVPATIAQVKALEKEMRKQSQQLKGLVDEAAVKLDEAYALVSKKRTTRKQDMLNKILIDAEYEIDVNTLKLI